MAYLPGPFDRNHGYIQWGGSLPGGEEWSCGIRVAATEQLDGDPSDAPAAWDMPVLLAHYAARIREFHIRQETLISSRCKLQFVKFNRIAVNGMYMDQTTYQEVFPDVTPSTNAQAVHPPNQVALAITLTTNIGRGPASKGRFYLPMPISQAGPDGLIPAAEAVMVRGSARTLIEDLGDVPGLDVAADPGPVVMSRKLGAPATRRISGIRVGRVLDTQQRRRRSLAETYQVDVVDQGVF